MCVRLNETVQDFTAKAFVNETIRDVKLSDYKGKWVVLFFYPADFTFVCPTELGELADHYEEFKKMDVEILSMSTDTHWVHKAWHDSSEQIKKIKFPMLSDANGLITKSFGIYIEKEGVSHRGTYVINPEGKLVLMEVHVDGVGRSAVELIRKIQAAQFSAKNGVACPASWKPGKQTLKPGLDLVGKI